MTRAKRINYEERHAYGFHPFICDHTDDGNGRGCGLVRSIPAFDYDRSDGVTAGQYDFYGSVAHEITEVMGRELNAIGNTVQFGAGYHPLDVFKFSSPGTQKRHGRSFATDMPIRFP